MKKFILLMAVTLISVGATAQKVLYQEAAGRNIEPTQNAVIVPLVAELELLSETKIEYVETFELPVTNQVVQNVDAYKRVALVNATKQYNADTMVAALISVLTRADGNALIITVTGFPAKYKNWRCMTSNDSWLLWSNQKNQQSTQIVR